MNILIVDDNNDKIAKIVSVIKSVSESFNIETVIDSFSAQLKLKSFKYDLLIVDLLLPIRKGESPTPHGGELLLKEISRNKTLIPPSIIVGITQFEEYQEKFSSLWKLLFFNKNNWDLELKEIVEHTNRSSKYQSQFIKTKPTLFVEGKSDLEILKESINLFNPQIIDKIEVKSEKGAGANWVTNQIVAWAYSLHKINGQDLIKSVGLLDGDSAGNEAVVEINRVIKSDSKGANSFKIVKLKPDYAIDTLSLFQKGLIIPITLEELYSTDFWEYSEEQGWLEERDNPDYLLKDPKLWDKRKQSLNDFITSLNLNETENRFLKTFKYTSKENAVKYILKQNENDKKLILKNFEKLINEISQYLLG